MPPTPAETSAGYAKLWDRARIDPNHHPEAVELARSILSDKSQYAAVQAATGVPWPMIGVLHNRESSLSFEGHLHNGDSLNHFTHHVPAGRPRVGHGPPFTWSESAVDALTMPPHSLNKVKRWTVERILHECEKYNGFGYRGKVNSPYLWSWTSEYDRGKFVRDGVFDPNFRDKQAGCVAVLKALAEIDRDAARLLSDRDSGLPIPVPTPPPGAIAFGEVSDRVARVQSALSQRNFPVGEIDGEFGPLTRAAVAAFQRDNGLPTTGEADARTLQALGLQDGGGQVAEPEPILRLVLMALMALLKRGAPSQAGPSVTPAPTILQGVLAALAGGVTPPPGAASGIAVAPPVLSPIDRLIGGEALAGKKTLLAVIAYVVLSILQVAGGMTPGGATANILTTLVAGFGGLGVVAKIDRAIQALSLAARK